jgi:hypothetical protein
MSIKSETFHTRSMDLTSELLQGAIDIHVHAGPHLNSSPRRADPFEAAEEARDVGMRAIVYMDVFSESCGTAWMVQRRVPDIEVYGGIILNSNYGGINPRAVKTALNYGAGAKFVQFGTHTTHFMASREARMVDGKPVLLKDLYPKFMEEEFSRAIRIPLDSVTPEIDEILTLIANSPGVYLNTGHVSGEEAIRLVDLAGTYGIKQVVIAEHALGELSVEEQKAVAKKGAFLEHSMAQFIGAGAIPRTHYYVEPEYMYDVVLDVAKHRPNLRGLGDQIHEIGSEHFIFSSDYGVRALPTPVEGMRMGAACFLDMDFSTDEIRTMMCTNPAKLLSLE